jgi:biotin-[acetyl-CoA-carboxylase] ligase BirA-like protein
MISTETHHPLVDSTMEAAKASAAAQDFLLVSADRQTRGRGTRGRSWQSLPGNLHMTEGINRRHLPQERLALFPLELGILIWESAAAEIPSSRRAGLSLKWPNDLLVGAGKAAGVLMEAHGDFLMAGIGINVTHAPEVEDGGTPSACLADLGMPTGRKDALRDRLYARIREVLAPGAGFPADKVLLEWQGKVDWSRWYRLRDRAGQPRVLPLGVNGLGHLRVRGEDGREEWLVSEYLL